MCEILRSTSPIMQVVGEAKVEKILEGTPQIIWEKTREKAGIDKYFFQKYFEGRLNS